MAVDYKAFFGKALLLKIGEDLLEGALLPAAQAFVADTSNPYDDAAFAFVKKFVEDFLAAQKAQP